ncbi:hypothetical protein L596_008361 [Steinernema carpocapsae]|uniref:Uncharacterized protein n=1 Tax=Steinernema carpocapsae TaxID=34508 RepID=A0A4U5PCI0_STECR|nr:hypothetical protein L596_008361 [Steinernema carpocapsae]
MYRVAQKNPFLRHRTGLTRAPDPLYETGHLERSRGKRPVGFTSFVSETDRSFPASELEMTLLCLGQ